mgnify:CR=1 FL=1
MSDDGDLVALRYDNWKVVFAEQRVHGTIAIWMVPFVFLRVPKFFNLRTDPFERADQNSNTYWDWHLDHVYIMYISQNIVAQEIQSLVEFPPRQEPASFNLDSILATLEDSTGGGMH